MTEEYEKHTTHTDALDTLGNIITPEEKRDAIHLAVEPVESGGRLAPGDHVVLESDGRAYLALRENGIGIVDPFLTELIKPGDWFWLVVYPRQISSLRHVWEHPSFPPSGETHRSLIQAEAAVAQAEHDKKAAAQQWLENFCLKNYVTLEECVEAIEEGTAWDTNYLVIRDSSVSGSIPSEFWTHMETYLGRTIKHHAEYFSCSC